MSGFRIMVGRECAMRIWWIAGTAALFLCAGSSIGWAAERLPGPVAARLIEVIDGDTLLVEARIWLGQALETRVRLAGIDAPEMRARCARERAMAEEAAALLRRTLHESAISLSDIRFGKYAGRVIARVRTADGRDLSDVLQRAHLARAYNGRKRQSWCSPTSDDGP